MEKYEIGEFVANMGHLGWGGLILPGVAVGCPSCQHIFMMTTTGLKDLVGQTRHCPYCDEESQIPSTLPRFMDIRPSGDD